MTTPPPIPEGHRSNLNTILKAAKHGNLCLVSCILKATQQPVVVLAAMTRNNDDGTFSPIPFATMFDDNPYELLEDPTV